MPPLWGQDTFNDGAGMARIITFANFIHFNMPHGTDYVDPQLSVDNAWDIAAFVLSHPRPHLAGIAHDFPDLAKKPVDAPYGPYADHFSEQQHKYGPFGPIEAAIARLDGRSTDRILRSPAAPRAPDKETARRPTGRSATASATSKRAPELGTSCSDSMSFAVLTNRTPASPITATPMAMKARPATFAKAWLCALSWRCASCRGGDLKEQIEALDDEAERHHRNRGADPGQESPFIGGVIAVALDHRKFPGGST